MEKRKIRHSSSDRKTFEKFVKDKYSAWKIKDIKTIRPARKTFPGAYEATLIPQVASAKYKIGDKVHYTDRSWNEDGKYIVNATIVGMTYLTKKTNLERSPGIFYHIKPTKKSVEELWDVDREEIKSYYDNPKYSYHKESYLKAGWVKDSRVGYQ